MILGKTESVILYLLIYLLSALFLTLGVRANKGGTPFFILAILIPVVFAANRHYVGTDFRTYLNIYHKMSDITFGEFLSSGSYIDSLATYLIAKTSKLLGGERIFFGIYALAIYLPVGLAIKKGYRATPLVIVVTLFLTGLFTDGMNVMRQVAAVSVCFYGLQFVYTRQFAKYVAIIAMATLIHSSAIVAVVIYFLWDKNRQKVFVYPSVAITCSIVLAAYFFRGILEVLIRFPLFSRFVIYIDNTAKANNYLIFVHIAVYIVLLLIKNHMNALDRRNDLLYLLTFMGICFEFTGFSLIYAKRIAMYFYEIPSIILLAQTPLLFRDNVRVVVNIGVLLFAISLFIIRYAVLGHANVIPYVI